MTDSVTGVVFLPGCCNGLEDWHDPDPCAERHGETVRLTVDAERNDSPVIELPATDLRRLLIGAEHDLAGFLALAADWAAHHLPGHAAPVTAALARALDLPTPVTNPEADTDTP